MTPVRPLVHLILAVVMVAASAVLLVLGWAGHPALLHVFRVLGPIQTLNLWAFYQALRREEGRRP